MADFFKIGMQSGGDNLVAGRMRMIQRLEGGVEAYVEFAFDGVSPDFTDYRLGIMC